MPVTAQPYGRFLADLTKGVHNLGTDQDYLCLLSSAYTPDLTAHGAYSDVSGYEVTGAGYTPGGALTSLTPGGYVGGTTNLASVGCADVSWATLTVTFRYATLYRLANTPAAGRLIGLFDFGTDKVYSASPLKLTFPAGILTLAKG